MDCSLPGSSVHGDSPGKNTRVGCHFFLHLIAEQYSIMCVCVYQIFTHFSIDGHLGFFHVLAIVNSAAMNIGVHLSFQIRVFFISGYMPTSEIAGSYSNCFQFFKKFLDYSP